MKYIIIIIYITNLRAIITFINSKITNLAPKATTT